MSIKEKAVAEGAARAVAWFTTSEPQNIPNQLVAVLKKLPVTPYIRKRYNTETFTFQSFDDLTLHGTVFHSVKGCNWDGKNHVVLLVHGFQVQQAVMWPEMAFFLPHGYDCVTIDLRASGLSDKTKCTMGYFESMDVAKACEWIREKYGDDVVLGLYGQSMGSATIMRYSSEDPNLGFLIEDCGYASLSDTVREIHDRLLGFVDWDEFYPKVLKYAEVSGVTYEDVQPIESIKKLDPDIPMLCLHSLPDAYIVCDNVDKVYEAKRGKKEIHKYTLAPHSGSFMFHPIQYNKDISDFLKKYGLTK